MQRVLLWLACLASLIAPAAWAADIRLAVGLAKPPYVEEGGRTGLEAELAIAALELAGHRVEVVQVPQARGLAMLQDHNVDAMITLIPGAASGLFYSQPLLLYRNRAIMLQHSPLPPPKAIAELSRYRVASFQNARRLFGDAFTQAVNQAPYYGEHADQDTLNKLLLNRRVDIVIGDEMIFHASPTQQDLAGRRWPVRSIDLFGSSPRHVGFHQESLQQVFDAALGQLRANGGYARIVQFYRSKYRLPE